MDDSNKSNARRNRMLVICERQMCRNSWNYRAKHYPIGFAWPDTGERDPIELARDLFDSARAEHQAVVTGTSRVTKAGDYPPGAPRKVSRAKPFDRARVALSLSNQIRKSGICLGDQDGWRQFAIYLAVTHVPSLQLRHKKNVLSEKKQKAEIRNRQYLTIFDRLKSKESHKSERQLDELSFKELNEWIVEQNKKSSYVFILDKAKSVAQMRKMRQRERDRSAIDTDELDRQIYLYAEAHAYFETVLEVAAELEKGPERLHASEAFCAEFNRGKPPERQLEPFDPLDDGLAATARRLRESKQFSERAKSVRRRARREAEARLKGQI